MKTSENEIENMLRQAPEPIPPSGLRQKLIENIQLPKPSMNQYYVIADRQTWFQRWWPSLASAGLACGCLVAMGYQQSQIHALHQDIQELRQQLAQPKTKPAAAETTANTGNTRATANPRTELEQLRRTVPELARQIQVMDGLSAENQRLRSHPALQPTLDPEEAAAMAEEKEKVNRIKCVNNLKQLGLAVRIYATDNENRYPPNTLCISNEVSTPKVYICPSDTVRKPAENWASFTAANQTYEYFGNNTSEQYPNSILFRCPIHYSVCLSDGSVQMLTAERYAREVIQKDGKLFWGQVDNPAENRGSKIGTNRMSPQMMKRYGLTPANLQSQTNHTTDR
jgi:polyhydroxyalkanoate synthesis regulator phasin